MRFSTRKTITICIASVAAVTALPAAASAASFTNGAFMHVPSNTNATPALYPSPIQVKGLKGPVVSAKVSLLGLGEDGDIIDAMVVSPNGKGVVVMDGKCSATSLVGESFTFDDNATQVLPGNCGAKSGTFKPSGPEPNNSPFPGAGAGFAQSAALSAFRNSPANGTWNLFVRSNFTGGPGGNIGGGWSLDLEVAPDCAGETTTIAGTAAPETLVGTAKDDVFVGLGGNDTIRGLGGNDIICGGGGKDRLLGGAGRDRLIGQGGKDTCAGGGGRDTAARTCEKQKSA